MRAAGVDQVAEDAILDSNPAGTGALAIHSMSARGAQRCDAARRCVDR
jgi:hypothetical protein